MEIQNLAHRLYQRTLRDPLNLFTKGMRGTRSRCRMLAAQFIVCGGHDSEALVIVWSALFWPMKKDDYKMKR
jgi:hypothetical protein